MRGRVAPHPDMSDRGIAEEWQDRLGHSEPGAEDRHDDDGPHERGAIVVRERRADAPWDGAEIAGGLAQKQAGDFREEAPEFPGLRAFIAEARELYVDERVTDHGDGGWQGRRGHAARCARNGRA